MSWQSVITLKSEFFSESEKELARFDELTALLFRFDTGVHGLKLANRLGEIVVLPFQGQQVWDAAFLGRRLTMQSMFNRPYPTQVYLNTYGGFLVHCGATAMGVPGESDSHPLHGELPNAPYQSAELLIGQDELGPYMSVTGSYQYTVAFSHNYVAVPEVRLYANASRITVTMKVHNLKQSPMELMYLAHVNFRPVDNGRLLYSAPCDTDHVRVRSSIPSHITPPAGYREFLQELAEEPAKHNELKPDLAFNPEVVFFIDYQTDADGWAHSMQVHPDGSADYISHRPDQLDHGVRWISRTPDQDCLGIVLPATAEPEGYTAEKEKGNIKQLAGGAEWVTRMEIGTLTPDEAAAMAAHISQILAGT
jgi:hypothetical protein